MREFPTAIEGWTLVSDETLIACTFPSAARPALQSTFPPFDGTSVHPLAHVPIMAQTVVEERDHRR